MPQQTMADKLKETDKEVAVLQVQYVHLTEKIEDVRAELKDNRAHLDSSLATLKSEINETFKEFQTENKAQHKEAMDRVGTLEKWKWMIVGGSILAASVISLVVDKFLPAAL